MGCEVDFLRGGNGEKGGDAIAMRWGTPGNCKLLVYGGGTQESGEALVANVRTHYQTSRVDYVVSSQPDGDHASGLAVVLRELEVGELWMHRPWEYSAVIREHVKGGRIADESPAAHLRARMQAACRLEEMAIEKGIPIAEPFQGDPIGPFWVLSPSEEWYIQKLIPTLEKSLGQKSVPTTTKGVTLFAYLDGRDVLLSGDAGIQVLSSAGWGPAIPMPLSPRAESQD